MSINQAQKTLLKKYKLDPNLKSFKQELSKKIHELEISQNFQKKQIPFYQIVKAEDIESNIVRCPDSDTAKKMIELIEKTKAEQDSIGGVVVGVIKNCPVGLGEPEFDKLPAQLAKAMLSINATKGFEIGSGFEGTKLKGSKHNDIFAKEKSSIKAILVDIDGVLSLPFQLSNVLEKDFGIFNAELILEDFWKTFMPSILVGNGDLIESLKPFLQKLNWKKSAEEFIKIWHQADNKINWNLLQLLQDFRQKNAVKIYAFTQQEKYRAKYLKEVQFPDLFDGWFVSHELELLKTDKAIFSKVISKLDLKAQEILLIDDSFKVIDLAKSLGLETLEYNMSKDSIKKVTQKLNSDKVITLTNYAGGVLGGISNGQTIYFRVAIKPVATISQTQKTLDKNQQEIQFEGKGRHDPCVLPRAVPIVETMAALVIMDFYLRSQSHAFNF